MVPMNKLMGIEWAGEHLLTGLPEYRNGGLLIDIGLLTLKDAQEKRGLENYNQNSKKVGQPSVEVVPMFPPEDDVVVEWRACTLGFLDMLLPEVNRALRLEGEQALTLAQMLEAGTWKVTHFKNCPCLPQFLIIIIFVCYREVEKLPSTRVQTQRNHRL